MDRSLGIVGLVFGLILLYLLLVYYQGTYSDLVNFVNTGGSIPETLQARNSAGSGPTNYPPGS